LPAVPSHSRSTPPSRGPGFLSRIPLGRSQLLAVGLAVLAVVGVIVGLALSSGGAKPAAARKTTGSGGHGSGSSASSSSTPHATTSTLPNIPASDCPLTDTPAPGGIAPSRPALAVKIGNEPGDSPATGAGARPQSGLDEADIVYDTPTEGFLTRYIAVFQCQDASSIGPIRSVRWVDWHILREFVHPILAFAGGIDPDVHSVVQSRWIDPANLIGAQFGAATQLASRAAPDATYSSTTALYGLYKKATTAPRPVFAYSQQMPGGAVDTTQASIDYSAGTDVEWKWDAASHSWLHYYLGNGSATPDTDALTNQPVSTSNVVIMIVSYKFGPYAESPGSTGDFESQTLGHGQGYVLRDGKAIGVTWHRAHYLDGMTFSNAHGPVTLSPGRTWVELVPNTTAAHGAIVITHGATAAPGSTGGASAATSSTAG
jgi:hypothetical protein